MAKDKFDQFMHLQVTMSASNTLTFSTVALGGAVFEYAGIIFSRLEYYLSTATWGQIVTNVDSVDVALTGSDSLADLSVDQPQLYDRMTINVTEHGTAANANLAFQPITHDFSTMSGGGLMIPAQTLYLGMVTTGFTAAGVATCRAYYRVEKLTAADFVELVQRYRILST